MPSNRDARDRLSESSSGRDARRMKFLDAHGLTVVEPADAHQASELASYWASVSHYLSTGDDGRLRRFQRMQLRLRGAISLPFLTDLDTLDRLARAGEMSFEDLYEFTS